jgi:hypothetical protein
MANNYTQFSFGIRLATDEQITWARNAVAYLNDVGNGQREPAEGDEFYGILYDPEEPEYIGYEVEVDQVFLPSDGGLATGLWFHSDESGDMERLVPFVQEFLSRFDPEGSVGASWADTCSAPRVDEFGGGAVYITAEGTEWMSTYQWLADRAKPAEHPLSNDTRRLILEILDDDRLDPHDELSTTEVERLRAFLGQPTYDEE